MVMVKVMVGGSALVLMSKEEVMVSVEADQPREVLFKFYTQGVGVGGVRFEVVTMAKKDSDSILTQLPLMGE